MQLWVRSEITNASSRLSNKSLVGKIVMFVPVKGTEIVGEGGVLSTYSYTYGNLNFVLLLS